MSSVTLSSDLLIVKFCMVYRQLMGCISIKYEVKICISCVILIFDILISKWCVTNHPLMDCICATYEANESNNHGAVRWTPHKLQMTRATLTFKLETVHDTSHPHASHPQIYHIGLERPRGHSKKMNYRYGIDLWPFDPKMTRDTSSPHMLCFWYM